jgi:leader peptidase (prepilin peptidase)/N-methyltransferase
MDIPSSAWAAFGLCAGSFVNVLISRLPWGASILRPRSRCPLCLGPIAFYDNVPVLSFLLLRGRCRRCAGSISARYPIVEALIAAAAAALALRWPGQDLWIALALCASCALAAVAFIDFDTFLIPDELSLGLLASGILLSPFNPLLDGSLWRLAALSAWPSRIFLAETPLWRYCPSLAGGLFGLVLCWALAALGERVFKKEAMGGGDVKLLGGVGAWTGMLGAYDCLIVASLLGAVYGAGLLLGGRLRRQDPIPFGPFLSAAAFLNFFFLLPFGFPF